MLKGVKMKLPVYNSSKSITTETPNNIRNLDTYSQGAKLMTNAGSQMQALSQQWQESKDEVENLNARNQLQSQMTSILDEANNFNEYTTPAELQAKQDELSQRMGELTGNIMSGFSNNQKAREFESNANLAVQQNNIRLQGIFREKQIDMGRGNLITSQETNQEGFIATGNPIYKQTYLNDLETMRQAGIIDFEYAERMKQKTDEWDVYHVLRQAETNPDEVINGLKNGKYNIKPKDYNDLLKDVTSIKTNAELLRNYEELQKQNQFEDEATKYIYGNTDYADKLKYINEQEFLGNISTSFATKARRNLKKFRPESEKLSDSQSMNDVIMRAYDISTGGLTDEEYLKAIQNLRNDILTLHETGSIDSADVTKLNNRLATITNKKVAEATNNFANGIGEAKKYIDNSLPPELRAEAVRNVFYSTYEKDIDNLDKKQIKELYSSAAKEVVTQMTQNNRQKALAIKEQPKKENNQTTTLNDGQIIVNPNTGERRILKGGKWQKI
jgi:hypothetical protein